jgi:hypothetical protein
MNRDSRFQGVRLDEKHCPAIITNRSHRRRRDVMSNQQAVDIIAEARDPPWHSHDRDPGTFSWGPRNICDCKPLWEYVYIWDLPMAYAVPQT